MGPNPGRHWKPGGVQGAVACEHVCTLLWGALSASVKSAWSVVGSEGRVVLCCASPGAGLSPETPLPAKAKERWFGHGLYLNSAVCLTGQRASSE